MKKRENGLDLARLISAFLVVIVHVCSSQRKMVMNTGIVDFDYHFFVAMRHFAQAAVPVFIMLSGAFVLKGRSTCDYKAFYKKSFGKLVIPTVIFSVLYLFLEWYVYYRIGVYGAYPDGNVALQSFIFQLGMTLQGAPAEHMWYMYSLIGLYILAPFVAHTKDVMGERDFTIASIVMCIWGVIDALAQPPFLNWGIGYVARLLGIFMMGYVVHEWALKKKGNGLAIGLILAGLIVNCVEYLIHLAVMNNTKLDDILACTRPYNAFVVVSSMLYVAGFTILDIRTELSYPSALTYWVYLVHPAVMMALFFIESAIFHVPYLELGTTNPILFGLVNTVIVYLLSFVVGHIIEICTSGRKKKAKA